MRLPNWFRLERDGVGYFQAWNLHASGKVRHGFSTRLGGVSPEPFDTLNLGLGTADRPEDVIENRARFGHALGLDASAIVVPKQVHGKNVVRVDSSFAGRGATSYDAGIDDCDAIITDTPGLTLALHYADCVPIFLLDPENRAIGMVHAGWKGTSLGIARAAVEAMTHEFGTDPGRLQAAIGPAICRFCFDVDADVAQEFFKAFPHNERVMNQSGETKWRVDLKMANQLLLTSSGVLESNIAVCEECTSCNRAEFFSHRRDGETGRMAGWISLSNMTG